MARFSGKVGYGETQDKGNGVWEEVITEERVHKGDVVRNSRNLAGEQKVNDDITVSNAISIVADQKAIERFSNIKYVEWNGVLWTVTSVEVQRPRLILNLGSVYNGPTL